MKNIITTNPYSNWTVLNMWCNFFEAISVFPLIFMSSIKCSYQILCCVRNNPTFDLGCFSQMNDFFDPPTLNVL